MSIDNASPDTSLQGREFYPCNLHITWYFSGNASLYLFAFKSDSIVKKFSGSKQGQIKLF